MSEKKGNFWIWGLHSVLTAIEKRPELLSEVLYVESELSDATRRRMDSLRSQKSIEVRSVPQIPRSLEEHRHQGIAANLRYFPTFNERDLQQALGDSKASGQWLLLDGIEDPRNYGAILRSAAAFGVAGVIVGEKFQAPLSGVVAQASAGTCFLLPIYEISTTLKLPELVQSSQVRLIGLDGDGLPLRAQLADLHDKKEKIIWIVGAEGKGIHSRLKQKISQFVSIPLSPAVESLNASVAASIVLYEGHAVLTGEG
jgi:23S rRNA (guanosine2251-2'-O)-methyltransferase